MNIKNTALGAAGIHFNAWHGIREGFTWFTSQYKVKARLAAGLES